MQILVTGASGQLGSTLKEISKYQNELDFIFKSSRELDITDPIAVENEFNSATYAYCINCAAFTNVDLAETEIDKARSVNIMGARNLALSCKAHNTILVHVSTDFVFDGYLNVPYNEEDIARPLGFYGDTKYKGERAIVNNIAEHFIIRTSWLYSEHGHNFMKTMIRLGRTKDALSVVYDQVGTPTYAKDLAAAILTIIKSGSAAYGIYNYSNHGVASWYDFAGAIFTSLGIQITLKPILSEEYPTAAERPKYSVLDKSKIERTFHLSIPYWRDSLQVALKAYANIPA